MVVIGWHRKDDVWEVLAADRMRGSPSQQAEFIAGRACAWGLNSFWQEAVKDEALITVVQRVLREKGASIAVRAEKPTINKEVRITQTLEPALAAGLLRVCGDKFPELRAEALAFPAGSHDDLLDALEGAFTHRTNTSPIIVGDPTGWGPGDPADSDHPAHQAWKDERMWDDQLSGAPDWWTGR